MPATSELERLLRAASLRVTRPRLAVLGAVHQYPHADTAALIGHVRDELGEVSSQAVYDVLHALTTARLVRRIQPEGSVARYESRVGDNHHHVICRACGAIADVDCAVGHRPCLTAVDDHGYVIDEAEVIYWGRCPRCVAADASSAAALHRAPADRALPADAAPPHAADADADAHAADADAADAADAAHAAHAAAPASDLISFRGASTDGAAVQPHHVHGARDRSTSEPRRGSDVYS